MSFTPQPFPPAWRRPHRTTHRRRKARFRERQTRTLASGKQRVYTYVVSRDGSQHRSLSSDTPSSVSLPLYRSAEKNRIVAALQANSSILIVSEQGSGKTTLAEAIARELQDLDFCVALARPMTGDEKMPWSSGSRRSIVAQCGR